MECCFRMIAHEIPKVGSIFEIALWIGFLWVDHVGKIHWVSHEKDWSVETHQIMISFFGIKSHLQNGKKKFNWELKFFFSYRHSSWISFCICGTPSTTYSRKSNKYGCFSSFFFQKIGFCISDLLFYFLYFFCVKLITFDFWFCF